MRINFDALREDLRKLAIALFIAGFVGFFINEQDIWYSVYIVVSGLFLWIFGLIKTEGDE